MEEGIKISIEEKSKSENDNVENDNNIGEQLSLELNVKGWLNGVAIQ